MLLIECHVAYIKKYVDTDIRKLRSCRILIIRAVVVRGYLGYIPRYRRCIWILRML